MGVSGNNVARCAALYAGCPPSTSGATLNRFCSSGLNAIANISQHIISGAGDVGVGCGVDSISMTMQMVGKTTVADEKLMRDYPALYMPMIETADILSQRYGISREDQDRYAVESQRRTAAAQDNGLYDHEIVPMDTLMAVKNKETGEMSEVKYTVTKDECNRPGTTYESVSGLVRLPCLLSLLTETRPHRRPHIRSDCW